MHALLLATLVASPSITGLVDWDDDDRDGRVDWTHPHPSSDDDLVRLVPSGPGPWQAVLFGAPDEIRLFADGDPVLGGAPMDDVGWIPAGANLHVQFGAPGTTARLELRGPDGVEAFELRSAPLRLPDPLQPVEALWILDLPPEEDEPGTGPVVRHLQAELGPVVVALDGEAWDLDYWLQDQFEVASATVDGRRLDVVMESSRGSAAGVDRSLAAQVALDTGAALASAAPGPSGPAEWYGNLEVLPPHAGADGREHPFGRLLIGAADTSPLGSARGTLGGADSQEVLEIDVSWLCVGHADELVTVLPDPVASRGFRVGLASPGLALALLDAATDRPLPRYERLRTGEPIRRLADLSEAPIRRALNQRLQANHLDPLGALLREELGLRPDELVELPVLFDHAWDEDGYCGAVAITPDLANAVPLVLPDGDRIILPVPGLARPGQAPHHDPFRAAVEATLPPTLRPVWVDGFDAWHRWRGGPHCATQVRRTPRYRATTTSSSSTKNGTNQSSARRSAGSGSPSSGSPGGTYP